MSGAPARTYCDRLTRNSVRALRGAHARHIVVLEWIDARQRVLARELEASGATVEQAEFFAGHLKRANGEAVYLAARRHAGPASLRVAGAALDAHPLLRTIDARQVRGTVRLSLAKFLVGAVEAMLVRAYAAAALATQAGCSVWLSRPSWFDPEGVVPAELGVQVHFYEPPTRAPLAFVVRSWLTALTRRAWAMIVPAHAAADQGPSVLAMREDDIHMDRSVRGQPHWLAAEDAAPAFNTYIATRGGVAHGSAARPELRAHRIHCLSRGDVARALLRHGREEPLRALRRDARSCFLAAARAATFPQAVALVHCAILLLRAEEMGALARLLGARTFLCSEPYFLEADAMQLIGPQLRVQSITFQYSNLAFMSPLMLTTADRMVLFAPMYRSLWEAEGVRPGAFEVGGYLFDGVAKRVAGRSTQLRARLAAAGARFMLCYFDENVQENRWGCVHPLDHHSELGALARLVVDDASVALIVKTQFERNSPRRRYPDDPVFAAAQATGRYVELCEGTHRNVIYPTEAALAADLCVGHLVGATASLEAALAGKRSVVLNPQGLRSQWDGLYAQADVVYPSMSALLAAIGQFRAADPARRALGDWSAILPSFDAFRDGCAVQRLRALLDRNVSAVAEVSSLVSTQEAS